MTMPPITKFPTIVPSDLERTLDHERREVDFVGADECAGRQTRSASVRVAFGARAELLSPTVVRIDRGATLPTGEGLLGRVLDGLGRPVDGLGP